MKPLFLISIILFALGCKSTKEISDQSIKNNRLSVIATLGETNAPSDPVTIKAIRVEKNTMFIDITYSGGCEDHTFAMVGSKMISKSLPPIRSVQLIHSAKGDHCRKLVEETLKVDISKLSYTEEVGSTIILMVNDFSMRIEYTVN